MISPRLFLPFAVLTVFPIVYSDSHMCCKPNPDSDVVVVTDKENKKGTFYSVAVSNTTCSEGISFLCLVSPGDERACQPRPSDSSWSFEISGENRINITNSVCSFEVECASCEGLEGTYRLVTESVTMKPATTVPPLPLCKFRLPDGERVFINDGEFVVRRKKRKCQHCYCDGSTGDVNCGEILCDPVPGCIRYDDATTSCCPGCIEFATPEPVTEKISTALPEPVTEEIEEEISTAPPTTPAGKEGDMCFVKYPDGQMGMYKDGEVWVKDVCTQCLCYRGKINCETINCNVSGCVEYADPPRGSCCGECTRYEGDCVDGSTIRSEGSSWTMADDVCTTCTCNSGMMGCSQMACSSEANCVEYGTPAPDQCCPPCLVYSSDVCQVDLDGENVTLRVGESKRGSCTTCACKKKKDGSAKAKCKPVEKCEKVKAKTCDGTVEVPAGKCCPECVPFPTTPVPTEPPPENCIDENNVSRVHNTTWRPSTCVDCYCNDSVVTCEFVQNVDCPDVPGCVRYEDRVGNECCPRCAEYAKPPSKGEPCMTTSGKREDGEYWQPNGNACYSCNCSNGATSCLRLQCQPVPGCDAYGETPDGECCPICSNYLSNFGRLGEDPCRLPVERGSCFGRFPRFYFNDKDLECKPFDYSGCAGNTNSFSSKSKCEATCGERIRTENSCNDEPDYGGCVREDDRLNGTFQRHFYNPKTMDCEKFLYSSCGGNGNNFESRRQCLDYCAPPKRKKSAEKDNVCTQVRDPGPCKANVPRFYFGRIVKECRPFFYGGCLGNENNFQTLSECQEFCKGVDIDFPPTSPPPRVTSTPGKTGGGGAIVQTEIPPDFICTLPKEVGLCKDLVPRYYFNFEMKRCEQFDYGGCGGNANNFASLAECQSLCPRLLYPMEACELPVARGSCKAEFRRFYYNTTTKQCNKFVFGGCSGNANNFVDLASCMRHCGGGLSPCFKKREKDMISCNKPGCFVTQCTDAGDFRRKQCDIMNFCWCVGADGKEVKDTRVPPFRAKLLRCGADAKGLKGCFRKQQKQLTKCGGDPTCDVVACYPDGTYATRQCSDATDDCYCLDRLTGKKIGGKHKKSDRDPCTRRGEPDIPTVAIETPSPSEPIITTQPQFQPTTLEPTTLEPNTTALPTTEAITPTTSGPTTDAPTTTPPVPLCGGDVCLYGSTCVEDRCRCESMCRRTRNPVCGTDGQTYRNLCFLRRTACLQMREVNADYLGRCGSRDMTFSPTPDACSLPDDTGPCRGYFLRYFYDSNRNRCRRFVYGGCGGNANRFATMSNCEKACGGRGPTDIVE